jgi:soluble lytic murein transglycosylase-like protein
MMNIGLLTSIAHKGVVAFAAVTGCICAHAELTAAPERLAGLRAEALSLEHGEGVSRNLDLAIQRYCEAARLGDAESQYRLGWIYANGRGVARDDGLASYLFSLAARQGNLDAERMLKYIATATAQPPKCMVDDKEAETIGFDNPTPAQKKVMDLIGRLAPEYGVSPRLALAVIRAESNFDPTAVSSRNAQGLMQLIPETAIRFNVRKPFDPEQNIRGGLSYLRWLLAYFKGDVTLVAAAYNAGEGAVNHFAGVPPFAETRGYVQRIRELFRRDQHPYDPSVVDPSPDLPRIRARMM